MAQVVLGLDIGGANLKAAWYSAGVEVLQPRSNPFALWRDPGGLSNRLRELVGFGPPPDLVAVTMTGELCDCYASKRQGVAAILDSVEASAAGVPIRVWTTLGRFLDIPSARDQPLTAAAANWMALATFAGRHAPRGPALLIDIGSTTTDIIALLDGRPVPEGRTDPQRLRSGELVYTGVRRTPVCALVQQGVAAELFATTLDAYLVLGLLPEDEADCNTADGAPATRPAADLRLARMLGADLESGEPEQRRRLALRVLHQQKRLIARALWQVMRRLPQTSGTVVLAGEGQFLARRALQPCDALGGWRRVSLARRLGPEVSRSACAHAVAVLAAEEQGWHP